MCAVGRLGHPEPLSSIVRQAPPRKRSGSGGGLAAGAFSRFLPAAAAAEADAVAEANAAAEADGAAAADEGGEGGRAASPPPPPWAAGPPHSGGADAARSHAPAAPTAGRQPAAGAADDVAMDPCDARDVAVPAAGMTDDAVGGAGGGRPAAGAVAGGETSGRESRAYGPHDGAAGPAASSGSGFAQFSLGRVKAEPASQQQQQPPQQPPPRPFAAFLPRGVSAAAAGVYISPSIAGLGFRTILLHLFVLQSAVSSSLGPDCILQPCSRNPST
jgi:hypothetical protein